MGVERNDQWRADAGVGAPVVTSVGVDGRSRRNTVIVAALIGLLLGIVAALVYEPATRAVRSRS